jgi:hypothetical protein
VSAKAKRNKRFFIKFLAFAVSYWVATKALEGSPGCIFGAWVLITAVSDLPDVFSFLLQLNRQQACFLSLIMVDDEFIDRGCRGIFC